MNPVSLSKNPFFVLFAVSLGGILFGYHTAALAGILSPFSAYFNLSLVDQGIAVSSVLLGGLAGALAAGIAADTWGRKKLLLATAFLFCLSTLIQALAPSYLLFLSGRFLAGVAVGLSSVVSPLYLGEVAPPTKRGSFVSTYQFMIALGILIAYAANMFFSTQWRLVFYMGLIPAMVQLVSLFFINETPAWLVRSSQIHATHQKDIAPTPSGNSHVKHLIIIGLLLSIFQQITGVNTVFYYAPKVLIESGAVAAHHSLMATIALGIVNLAFTVVSILFLDRLGRRVFLLLGVLCMLLGQILLALSFTSNVMGIIGVLAYIIGFAIGLGPITWVILSEIYPLKVRSKAIGLALFANWSCNYLITLTFLLLLKKLGITGTFTLYAAISFICLLFIYFYIPETKGKSLEEIELLVKEGKI